MIEIYIDDQTLVNVLSEYGDQAEGWIKTTLEEYFFHFRNETLDFELLHMAEKLAFMETSMRQKFHFLTPLDEIKPNEDNLTVGI